MTPTTRRLRVLIVDDSEMACDLIELLFSQSAEFEVVGRAANGQEALAMNEELHPNLITMDLHMPVMDGYEAVEHIMASAPVPILVITSYREAETAFRCINLGAVEVMDKPTLEQINDETFVKRFLSEARFLAGTRVISRPRLRHRSPPPDEETPRNPEPPPPPPIAWGSPRRLVTIATSTGGPKALSLLLAELPPDFPCGILVVQHLEAGFEGGLIKWLAGCTELPVLLAVDGASIPPGVVCFAPPGRHLHVTEHHCIRLGDEPSIGGHRPSARHLFSSAALAYGPNCAGVILTGMGDDGAKELGLIREAGGLTIAQDEASCVLFGMPRVAAELGTAERILSLDRIAETLVTWARLP